MKHKNANQHFSHQLRLQQAMERIGEYDIEYAQYHDVDEIMSNNDAYQEFLDEKSSEYY
jgi:hypothetical protein